MTTPPAIIRARELHARQAWSEVTALLSGPATAGQLEFADAERLAIANHMLGRVAEADEAIERAHHLAVDSGDVAGAARTAFWLGFGLLQRGEHARGGGWLARAARLLDEEGVERVEQGYLLLPVGLRTLGEGELDVALATFESIASIAERFADEDLATLGRLGRGRCLLALGERTRGLALIDDAMLATTDGDVSPHIVGIVYCAAIDACQEIFDLGRAQEWTAALSRWCEAQPDSVPYRGRCLVYRAELMVFHGEWRDAADEARLAHERLAGPPPEEAMGEALYQLAELERLRGSFGAAEAAYRDAGEHGRRPEPGMALLRLAQGRPEIAAAAIRRAVDESEDSPVRPRLLGPCVEILLAGGRLDDARTAADELARIATEAGYPLLYAMADAAVGAVHVAAGDARSGLPRLRRAFAGWQALDSPYEAARVRVLIAEACRLLGDHDAAEIELAAATRVFRDLGAAPDLARIGPAAVPAPSGDDGLTAREVEILRLLATGLTNRAISVDLVISERTVDRHVSNIFAKVGVSSRSAATAYAYENDLT